MTNKDELRALAVAANRPMSEIGLMEHKRAAMNAMHGALLPDDVLSLLDEIDALKAEIAVMRTQMIDMSWVCNKCGKWSEYCHCVKALHAAPGSKP